MKDFRGYTLDELDEGLRMMQELVITDLCRFILDHDCLKLTHNEKTVSFSLGKSVEVVVYGSKYTIWEVTSVEVVKDTKEIRLVTADGHYCTIKGIVYGLTEICRLVHELISE